MSASERLRRIQVMASSRLHFGLLSFGQCQRRQFGGVGVMIQQPTCKLYFTSSSSFDVAGKLSNRVLAFVHHWTPWHGHSELPLCRIEVESVAREHVGLGVGTQLGLSVASGLNRFSGRPEVPITELVQSVGRGARSAVGSYGFLSGGLIVDAGKTDTEQISPLEARLPVPASWRWVLICPQQGSGLSGESEGQAFEQLPPVSEAVSERLKSEIQEEILPAVREHQFERFAQAVFRFGERAGSCFATVQGGSYHGQELIRRVDWLRSLGIEGVGQSSWGPTLFALFEDESAAGSFVTYAQQDPMGASLEYQIASTDNSGARFSEGLSIEGE
ncbi:MAG: hypothetical protein VB912_10290 [Pirellulaceae bacterium]